jgi:replication initiation and membrane attachment protein
LALFYLYHVDSKDNPQTQKEKWILYIETTSSLQVLNDYSGGIEPTKQAIDFVETLLVKKKLPPCVVNVLIEDVIHYTDIRHDSPNVEKTASHWSRKK